MIERHIDRRYGTFSLFHILFTYGVIHSMGGRSGQCRENPQGGVAISKIHHVT